MSKLISLTRGLLTVVDDCDYEHISRFRWRIVGNPLDNRRANLRICTQADNMHNRQKTKKPTTSKYKGVHRRRATSKPWFAKIRVEGKSIYIGIFENEIDAARAYDKSAQHYFGEFAHLNFPHCRAGSTSLCSCPDCVSSVLGGSR